MHPDALELCDDAGIDENCDGVANDATAYDAIDWYEDKDGDGAGDPESTVKGCDQPLGYVERPDDCDDSDS